MNWPELATNQCPYCNGNLVEVEQEFVCLDCNFKIDTHRKISIETHRAHPENACRKLKWQNLVVEKCPVCSSDLCYGIGPYEILACLNGECSFKIRYDKLQEILDDPTHPCRQFYEREKQKIHGIE